LEPYRAKPASTTPPRLVAKRPLPRLIVGVMIGGLVMLAGLSLLVKSAASLIAGLVFFGPALLVIFGLRMTTVVFDDRVEQGRIGRRSVALADVVHVYHRSLATDPYLASTATTAADLDTYELVSSRGARVVLSSIDLPAALREELVNEALSAAIAAAEQILASGGRYQHPSGLHALDAKTLYGYTIGVFGNSKEQAPLSRIEQVTGGGVVRAPGLKDFLILPGDLVLLELLRARQLMD
jgi:hypothetical protein